MLLYSLETLFQGELHGILYEKICWLAVPQIRRAESGCALDNVYLRRDGKYKPVLFELGSIPLFV